MIPGVQRYSSKSAPLKQYSDCLDLLEEFLHPKNIKKYALSTTYLQIIISRTLPEDVLRIEFEAISVKKLLSLIDKTPPS